MILDMGDYEAVDVLEPKVMFTSSVSPDNKQDARIQRSSDDDARETREPNLLRLNWELLEGLSTISRQGTIH